MKCLPTIRATPKFHKNPIKFRYIIASKTAVTKPLSRNLGYILKIFLSMITTYSNILEKFKFIKNCFG